MKTQTRNQKRGRRSTRYRAYQNKVRKLTREQNLPKFYGHTIDHIVPVNRCFKWDIPAEDAASLRNLQVIPFQQNIHKGTVVWGEDNPDPQRAEWGRMQKEILAEWGF